MQACFSPGLCDRPARISQLKPSICASDSAVKQILLTLNEKENFIIEDLDDFHVVIKADEEYRVRRELEAEVRLICTCHSCDGPDTVHSLRRTHTAWSKCEATVCPMS